MNSTASSVRILLRFPSLPESRQRKSDVIVLHFKQAAVGEGHTVGVASENSARTCSGPTEGRLGVDHPFFLPVLLKPGVKANRISNCLHTSNEVELFLGIRFR